MGLGMPRFILNFMIGRRQSKFTSHFADAMDIIVRGVRTGLPLGDCLKIIAHESPDPLGAEFRKVVEGESICLLYTSPSPRDRTRSRMPSSA